MKNASMLLAVGIAISITSCGQTNPNNSVDEGSVKNNKYTSSEIGWSIEIPKGWTLIEKASRDASTEKGLEAIGEVIEGDLDFSGLKDLIGFQKNAFNVFQSTSEPFEIEYEGEWSENNAALKEVILLAYQNQGIKADSSVTTMVNIDGLDFESYSFKIYGPQGNLILEQILFSRLINGYDFGVNINYNNEKDRDEMLNAFRNSKFSKK